MKCHYYDKLGANRFLLFCNSKVYLMMFSQPIQLIPLSWHLDMCLYFPDTIADVGPSSALFISVLCICLEMGETNQAMTSIHNHNQRRQQMVSLPAQSATQH